MATVLSRKGRKIDFNLLRQQHGNKPAIGNANMNARGDKIDSAGVVLKTQEQIEAEWLRQQQARDSVTNSDIRVAGMIQEPQTPISKTETRTASKRKIVESDQ